MSSIIFVGPSSSGKTYFTREWLLPMLLTRPRAVSDQTPERFTAALIHDAPTVEHPNGQFPGQRFRDVADWLRAKERPRVACLEQPSSEAMCEIALSVGRIVLVFDELYKAFPTSKTIGPAAMKVANEGRRSGVFIIGSCRRLKQVNTEIRGNMDTAYFGALTDEDDRRYAAETAGVSPDELDDLGDHVFLEYRPGSGRALTRVENRRKMTIAKL